MVELYIDYFTSQVKEMYTQLIGTQEEIASFDESHYSCEEPIIITFKKLQAPIDNTKINQPLVLYVEVHDYLKDDVYKVLSAIAKKLNETIVTFTEVETLDGDTADIEVTQNFDMPYVVASHINAGDKFKTLYGVNINLSYSDSSNLLLSNQVQIKIDNIVLPSECILSSSYQEAIITEGINEVLTQKNMPIALKHSIIINLYIKKDDELFKRLTAPTGGSVAEIEKYTISYHTSINRFVDKMYRSQFVLNAQNGAYVNCTLTFDTRWWD